ncbi:MAG TPA: TadE/TadG family type IV pilus assembly protein [Terracidiphilus sp.]|jgi:Flp pilus assembly protein TadG
MKTFEIIFNSRTARRFSLNQPLTSEKAAISGNRRLKRICIAFQSDVQGGALVEMAVTLPLILLLMTGIFSFSVALYQKLQLAEAVSNAGRVLAAERGDTDPCKTTTSALYAAAPGLAQSNLTISYTLNGVSVGSGVTSCSGTTNMIAGGSAQITATYPTSVSVYGKGLSSFNLATQITEVVQ